MLELPRANDELLAMRSVTLGMSLGKRYRAGRWERRAMKRRVCYALNSGSGPHDKPNN